METSIEGDKFWSYGYIVNQMFGVQSRIPSFLISVHQVDTITDLLALIERIEKSETVFNEAIKKLELSSDSGVILPKFLMPKVIGVCENMLKGRPFDESDIDNPLLESVKKKIEKLNLDQKTADSLEVLCINALKGSFKDGYTGLYHKLIELEKVADTIAGVHKFPKGDEYYKYKLKEMTTTDLTPDEIFSLGHNEISRIHAEMKKIKIKVGFEGDLDAFFKYMRDDTQFYFSNDSSGKAQYLAESVKIIDTIKTKLPLLFQTFPKADLDVKPVEPFREKSAGVAFYYRGTPDGSRNGIYYVNLYDMTGVPKYEMEALAYHEALPGHHMQISIAQELKGLPKYRTLASFYTAYTEGWGLYSEYIPKEIGLYQDPYSDFGRLSMELWRACRLVVDVGIHAKKWSRQEGINFYLNNTPASYYECEKMVDRHCVLPGQATSYKIGQLKFLELKKKSEDKLGKDFDIKEFHDVVLKNGALPLTVLEKVVNDWLETKQ